jgi:hypothetical protein
MGETRNAGFCLEYGKETDRLEDLGIHNNNIQKNLKEIGWAGVDLVHLAKNRDKANS